MRRRALAGTGFLLWVGAPAAGGSHRVQARPAGVQRALLLRKALGGLEAREGGLGTATVLPGGGAGRHFPHGHEPGYVLEGTAILEVEGYDHPPGGRGLPRRGRPGP